MAAVRPLDSKQQAPAASEATGSAGGRVLDPTRAARVLEHAADFVSMYDSSANCLYVSPAIEQSLGFRPEDLVGRPLWEFVHPDDRPILKARGAQLADKPGSSFDMLYRVRDAHDAWRWIESRITNLLDDPAVRAVAVASWDETPRIESQSAKHLVGSIARDRDDHLESIISHASDIITVVEADGTIRYASPSAERILGYPKGVGFGEDFLRFVHPDDAERVLVGFSRSLADPNARTPTEVRVRHQDGSWRILQAVANNLLDD